MLKLLTASLPPESSSAQVTDDFESYEPWSLSYGDWTTIDADGGLAGGLNQSMSYTHQGEQFAFLCWQPSDMFQSGQGLDPHSGTKALAGIYQVDETGQNFVDADNWLITPRLSGKAQTITFWVNNAVGDGYGKVLGQRSPSMFPRVPTTLLSVRSLLPTMRSSSCSTT